MFKKGSLLTNEIILNTIKHAYDPGKGGPIFISLKKIKKHLQLTIYDKGKGIVESPDKKTVTTGVDLINLLVQQIGGSLKKTTKNGVKYTIAFSPED